MNYRNKFENCNEMFGENVGKYMVAYYISWTQQFIETRVTSTNSLLVLLFARRFHYKEIRKK